MVASLALLSILAQGAAPKTLVAPSWATVDVTAELASFYSDHLAQALRDHGLKVITASEMRALLAGQRQLQLLGCTGEGTSCMTELANALGAEMTLLGSVAKLDESFELHLKVVSASTGAVLTETSISAKGQKALLDGLNGAAARLADQLLPPASRVNLRPWAAVPGVAALTAGGVGTFLLFSAHGTYDLLASSLNGPADAQSTMAQTLASTGKTQQLGGWIAVSIGIAAAVAAVVLLIVGGAE